MGEWKLTIKQDVHEPLLTFLPFSEFLVSISARQQTLWGQRPCAWPWELNRAPGKWAPNMCFSIDLSIYSELNAPSSELVVSVKIQLRRETLLRSKQERSCDGVLNGLQNHWEGWRKRLEVELSGVTALGTLQNWATKRADKGTVVGSQCRVLAMGLERSAQIWGGRVKWLWGWIEEAESVG